MITLILIGRIVKLLESERDQQNRVLYLNENCRFCVLTSRRIACHAEARKCTNFKGVT